MNSHCVYHSAFDQERVKEVSSNCWSITSELREVGQFVSVDKVLTVLLQRYGVVEFGQLMCGELLSIPTLSLLTEINRKVSKLYFLSNILTNHNAYHTFNTLLGQHLP